MSSRHLRRAVPLDAPEISALIRSLSSAFTLHPSGLGAEAFLKTIEPAAIASYIAAPNFGYFVAEAAGRIVGVVAIRDRTHLYHLFVAADQQRRGLASELWRHARAAIDAPNDRPFTVNATPIAVPVYERFGFVAAGPRVEKDGIAFIPMIRPVAPEG